MTKRITFRRTEVSRLETQFWLRSFAFVIDSFIVRLVLGILEFGIPSLKYNSFLLPVVHVVGLVLYSSTMESSRLQGTFGKWFLRFKVTDLNFNKISFYRALLRNFVKPFSIASIVGIFMIDTTSRRQALHDLIARTVLVRR